MTLTVIEIWIVVGGATGLVASILLSHVPMGVIGTVVIGILGGVLGGLGFGLLSLPVSGVFYQRGRGFVGSVILLAIAQKLL